MGKTGGALLRILLLLAMPAALLALGGEASAAVQDGLLLCARTVIPALFPFFAAVSFAAESGFFGALRALRLPVGGAVFLLGMLGGYPVGARTIGESLRSGQISRGQAQRLMLFCNNAGPAFALSIAGEGVFGEGRLGLILYALHGVSGLIGYALFFRRPRRDSPHGDTKPSPAAPTPNHAPSLPAAFVHAVQSAATGMVYVCAFVVFFLVLTRLCIALTGWKGPLWGILELTAGILRLPPDRTGFALAAGLLGWGGVSVHCQSAAMLADTGLPMGRYLAAKAVQGLLGAALAWLVGGFIF